MTNTTMTDKQNQIADKIFAAMQSEYSGRLIQLGRNARGDNPVISVHVALWDHDANGQLIILKNFWVTDSVLFTLPKRVTRRRSMI